MICFTGTGCSPGYAEGNVLIKKDFLPVYPMEPVEDPDIELRTLDESLSALREHMDELYEETLRESGEEAAELIETYQMILLDSDFFNSIKGAIRDRKLSCVTAVKLECDRKRDKFAQMSDPYMRERFNDILTVCTELIALCSKAPQSLAVSRLTGPTVVVADNLTPVDTVRLDKRHLMGFVTEGGGTTSHVVILARTLGIPAVVGVSGIAEAARNGMRILVSGESGEIILEPDKSAYNAFHLARLKLEEARNRFEREPPGEAGTLDGRRILLAVNSGDSYTADQLDAGICDGVGLFRTEFLYMSTSGYPDEETLFTSYRGAVEKMAGKEFVFRTLDIGGDKALPYMGLPKEENPFLGYRAIRICLDRPELFRTQLRAVLRASAFGRIKLMFPMITCLSELRESKKLLEACREELRCEGLAFDENIPVGIMVETPSSLFILDQLAAESDFFSVGTNDLVQYLMVADRGNPKVRTLYDPFQISVLRALYQIGSVAQKYRIPVGVCGEAASTDELVPFLIGCGVTELSVSSTSLKRLRWLVRRVNAGDCTALAERVITLDEAGKAKRALRDYYEQVS